MDIVRITKKSALINYRLAIENLFFESFGNRSIGNVWLWAYMDNPSGDPIVCLCYEGDTLVGHYAIVPMPLACGAENRNSYISMTTMIAESHRKFGLFTTLAQETYTIAQEQGVDFIYGFPNSQSTPGFRKRLNWILPEPDRVVTINKNILLGLIDKGYFDKRSHFGLNLEDQRLREWRLARPGGGYQWSNGLAFKKYNAALDLLWWKDIKSLRSLPDDSAINILVSAEAGLEQYKAFDYQLGGVALCSEFNPNIINREMAISDLF